MTIRRDYVQNTVELSPDNFYIKFSKVLHWYARDFQKMFNQEEIHIDQFIKSMLPLFQGEKLIAAKLLEEKIRRTREATGKVYHSYEFTPVVWSFNFECFKRNILNQIVTDE